MNHHQLAPFKLSDDQELREDDTYKEIIEVVKQLWETNVIARAPGYCFSISDMIYTLLQHRGINCEIVECQLMVHRREPPVMIALGYDHRPDGPMDVTTHVVVVTKTRIPILIDLSIGNLQPDQVRLIVERANGLNGTIATLDLGSTTWIYTKKRDQKFPGFHQRSIVERIETDQRVKKELSWLKVLVVTAIVIAGLNGIRGAFDFYQTYYVDGNFWGPDHNQNVLKRLENLERRLPPSPE